MAITVTTPAAAARGFFLNATSADASGCETLKAAPAAGTAIVLDHLTINNGANAISITVGEGETDSGVTAAIVGPIAFPANASLQWTFLNGGLRLTDATALTLDASGAGAICVFASGRILD